jgi:ATP-binding cassette subfamily B protein
MDHHPDRGGSDEVMKALNNAHELLKELFAGVADVLVVDAAGDAGMGRTGYRAEDVILAVDEPTDNRLRLLFLVVAAMVAAPIVNGALGLWQTYINNIVGQSVMRDLRNSLYAHLQNMSLKFFTSTRTGEIQSRIANDIGGVQTVVTSTATSIVSNVTTVLATVVAMMLLDWRLALFSLALTPFFVLITLLDCLFGIQHARQDILLTLNHHIVKLSTAQLIDGIFHFLAQPFHFTENLIAALKAA